jgi:hypothetical protein
MIPKSVQRFSEKIMLKQEARVGGRFEEKSSRSSRLLKKSPGGMELIMILSMIESGD